VIIDCAYDEKLSDELVKYLTENGFQVTKESDGVIRSNDITLTRDHLDVFLKMTDKIKELQVIPSEKNVWVMAIEIPIEGFGLVRCSVCGFVMYEEEVMAHERAHGIFLAQVYN
jgi:hypothetical protein